MVYIGIAMFAAIFGLSIWVRWSEWDDERRAGNDNRRDR